ncbi:MAG: PAS domain S-box protein [Burkholderiales bacterium]|nr:PAS domain S-box protein [Burkholderiales bacterium]
MLLAAAIALPLCAMVIGGAYRTFQQAQAEALDDAVARARLTAAAVDDQVFKVDGMLASLATALSARSEDASRSEAVLTALLSQVPPAFGALRLSDAQGMPIASGSGSRGSIADRRHFRRAIAVPGLAIGEATRVPGSDEWTLDLARRIVGDGGVAAGVVSISTRLRALQDLLDVRGLPAGAVVTLIDEQGVVLAHTREFATWVGRKLDDTAELASGAGTGRAAVVRVSADGGEWLSAAAALTAAPWHVQVSIPIAEALGGARREFRVASALAVGMFALALLLAWRMAGAMAEPLRRLAEDAHRIGEGGAMRRSARDEGGELGEALRALDRLAERTRERHAQLRDGEAKFRAMVEASPVGIFLARLDGNTIYTNPAYLRILGLPEAEARDLGWIRAIHPEDRDGVASAWHKAIASGAPYHGHGRYLHADGKVVWWQVRTAEVQVDDKLVGLVGMVEDVTEVREAQAALADSERRYRAMFASNPQPMWVYDVETLRFLDVNDAAVAHYGYSRDEFRAMSVLDIRPEEDRRHYERPGMPTTTGTVMQGVRRHQRKNGHRIEVEVASHDLMFKGRRAVHVLVNDVTERSRVEREILKLNAELEERVAARTAELTVANNELEAFTYSVAHDLRAPLRGIDGFSALLVENSHAMLDSEGVTYVERIRDASQRMGAMIADLLDLSRVSRRELFKLPVDLSAMAREIRDELQRVHPERAVEWRIADGLKASCDPGLIRLVLDNLLGNAWKYSAEAAAPVIEFGSRSGPGGRIEFYVRDNGVGFDMQYAGKLFSVFQRLHSAQKYEGTGIGLATVKRIVERHGGGVAGHGELGRGATFSFWLPEA